MRFRNTIFGLLLAPAFGESPGTPRRGPRGLLDRWGGEGEECFELGVSSRNIASSKSLVLASLNLLGLTIVDKDTSWYET